MTPADGAAVNVYIGETKEEPKKFTLNRAQKRSLAKSLALEFRRVRMPDKAKELRANRRAKRRDAAKVKNLNRRRK